MNMLESLVRLASTSIERGLIPDAATRLAVQILCRQRQRELSTESAMARHWIDEFVRLQDDSPIAPVPERANEQHYELPPEFFGTVLGARRKYSCCFWPADTVTLDEAEALALEITCRRAEIADGMHVLELGCGWGSLSLWIAEHFPQCRITAVSNSQAQRRYIMGLASERGLADRVDVITADMNVFDTTARFDRVVSVEMFEHMRNWRRLLANVARWLSPEGKLFVHIFCHRQLPYEFETEGPANWMGRYFFTGGIMPSVDLLERFGDELEVRNRWTWNGKHYARTCQAWLERLDAADDRLLPLFEQVYGQDARLWFQRWRVFFLVGSEFFAIDEGREWLVGHYLLEQRRALAVG